MMIPLSVSSQQKYKINGDTVVVFNLKETRKLAIKLLEGEKYERLYFTSNEIINAKDSIIAYKTYQLQFKDSLIYIMKDESNYLYDMVIDYEDKLVKERKKKRNAIWTAVGLGALDIILLIFCVK